MIDYYQGSLKSERLCSRPLTIKDADIWAGFFDDEETLTFLPQFGLEKLSHNLDKAIFWMERNLKRYSDKQFGFHALIERASGQFIGQCGLLNQNVEATQMLEVAYHILPGYRGLGYASEAARLFRDYAFNCGLSETLVSIIASHNTKSQKVACKNGMHFTERKKWLGLDVMIFSIDKNEWSELGRSANLTKKEAY